MSRAGIYRGRPLLPIIPESPAGGIMFDGPAGKIKPPAPADTFRPLSGTKGQGLKNAAACARGQALSARTRTARKRTPAGMAASQLKRKGRVKRSCAALMPAGGRGKGAARRTAASAARDSAASQLERAMRAPRRVPERDTAKETTTRHFLPFPRGR